MLFFFSLSTCVIYLQHLPLRYEVSYSLNGSENDDDLHILYHGLRHEFNFQLPAGLISQNYQGRWQRLTSFFQKTKAFPFCIYF